MLQAKQDTSKPLSLVCACSASTVSVISVLLSLSVATRIPLYIAIFFGIIALIAASISIHRIEILKKRQGEREALLHQAITEKTQLETALVPICQLLHEEDKALIALLKLDRKSVPGPEETGTAGERIRPLLNCSYLPDFSFLEKTKSIAALHDLGESVQEIELRIPYINALLHRVVEHTEKAALTLVDRFSVITEQTEQAEIQAKSAMASLNSHDASAPGLDTLIQESRASVVGRTGVINDFLLLNKSNSERVKKIGALVSRSEELLTGIEDISERSKLIAFNMAVESAKIGERGQGFKVIVHELQNLNNQTSTFAKDILEIVKTLRIYNQELMDQWLVKSEKLTDQVKTDTHQAEAAVSAMSRSYELTANLFRSLSDSTITVNQSMSAILESLQFQDITRQQIEGAGEFISDIEKTLTQIHTVLEATGCPMGDEQATLNQIRSYYRPKLKVSSDHDIFDQIERSRR